MSSDNNIDIKNTIEEKFKLQRIEYKDKIVQLSKKIRDVKELSDVQVELFSQRQIILEYTHKLIDILCKLNVKMSTNKRSKTDFYMNKSDVRYDRFDRKDIIEGELSTENYNIKNNRITNRLFKRNYKNNRLYDMGYKNKSFD